MGATRIHKDPLFYEPRLEPRPAEAVDLVVIHCTELPDLPTARTFGEKIHHPESGSGNCGHFYIDRDGRVEQWVDPLRIAHHVRGFNAHSIGIELVNRGRYPDWLHSGRQVMTEPYPQEQVRSLLDVLLKLQASYPRLRWIAGHEELDTDLVPASDDPSITVRRKLDPGPLFPWQEVLRATALERWPGAAAS